MNKKKVQKITVSQADEAQAKAVLEQFHTIAGELHSSKNQQEVEAALSTITALPDAAQMALLLALSKEHHTDAADVLMAINQLSPEKSIRKEAKRSLIRLEEARIYPQWESPVERISPFEAIKTAMNLEGSSNPPRYWKGIYSDTRDTGVVQMMLMWEQGKDYKDVRILGFTLDFLHDGVKDFYTRIDSKRMADGLIEEIKAREEVVDCSLAKGRSLIEKALEANKKHGTPINKDFRLSRSLVDELVLENPAIVVEEEEEEEEEEEIEIDPNLPPTGVVTSFVEAWVDEDYVLVYHFLADGSRLREGLTEEEWVERRVEWAENAVPDHLRPAFVREREPRKSSIWLPNTFSRNAAETYKEIDAGWSIVLEDTAEKGILPELPEETMLYEDTGRHWFWACFKLVEEPGGWRIDDMVDEGKNSQSIPAAELRKRIEKHDKEIEKVSKRHPTKDLDAVENVMEALFHVTMVVYYDDALIAQDPLDKKAYLDAINRVMVLGDYERAIVYLEGLARYYPEEQVEAWRQIGSNQLKVGQKYYDEDDEVRGERLLVLAETILRKSLAIEDNIGAHLLLSDALHDLGGDDKLEEAIQELYKAQALTKDEEVLQSIESQLGHMAMDREEYEAALSHYQRLVEMNPTYPDARYNLGHAYEMLGNTKEAIANYKQAIEIEPDNLNAYIGLSGIYASEKQVSMARKVLEEGAAANPDTIDLPLLLVSSYIESNDFVRAEEWMKKAESIAPDDDMIKMYRQMLAITRLQPAARSFMQKSRKR